MTNASSRRLPPLFELRPSLGVGTTEWGRKRFVPPPTRSHLDVKAITSLPHPGANVTAKWPIPPLPTIPTRLLALPRSITTLPVKAHFRPIHRYLPLAPTPHHSPPSPPPPAPQPTS